MDTVFGVPFFMDADGALDSEELGHEQDDGKDAHLEDSVKGDVAPHQRGDDLLFTGVRHT